MRASRTVFPKRQRTFNIEGVPRFTWLRPLAYIPAAKALALELKKPDLLNSLKALLLEQVLTWVAPRKFMQISC